MTRTVLVATIAAMVCIFAISNANRRHDASLHLADSRTLEQDRPQAPIPVGHPPFMSPHFNPIAVSGSHVFVVNTPSDTVDVLDAVTRKITSRIDVGVDPVSISVRPDGLEIWVSNHVSDSVSVIDNDAASPTYLQVLATIQAIDPVSKATQFDEPVGIAFANNSKAYVALSSANQIAVVNVETREVEKTLNIAAQDPRAIAVHGDRLYVLPFESNNKTQLSGGSDDEIDGELVTFDAWQHSIIHNNVLSLGHVVDIVKHPDVPDHDLFVFDTRTDELVKVVDTLGTLLYGLTIDSKGQAFVAQTDARNDINGRAGSKGHDLTQLDNRAFLNQITRVDIGGHAAKRSSHQQSPRPNLEQAQDAESKDVLIDFIDLEPLPPLHPAPGEALATPFAIAVSTDDSVLVASAAGSEKVFTVDAGNGNILGRVDVGTVPRGIALADSDDGDLHHAWVLNAGDNSVSLIDLSDVSTPKTIDTITLEDPTEPSVKRGRIAFEAASASRTGTYSCASCHPDGHTDQLLWVLKTPVVTGGDQIMPRSTMPIRGIRDTEPYHWDGIPGDPYGGNNSANVHGADPPNSKAGDPLSSARHLIDGGLAGTMNRMGDDRVNDEGKVGELSAAERDDMAKFLLSVPFPPAQKRAYTNTVSNRAKRGFELFHLQGHFDEKPKPNVCGDCHRMPFLVSTNTPGSGMDAPTWRGAYDRFLILPQGRLNIIEFDFYRRIAEQGIPERKLWQFSWQGQSRFDPVWDMVLEGSTGFSGAFARQITLSKDSAKQRMTQTLIAALEQSAREDAIVLEGDGTLLEGPSSKPVSIQFAPDQNGGVYVTKDALRRTMTRDELFALASDGKFLGTFTGRHGDSVDISHPQPAIWTRGPIEQQRGRQEFPILFRGNEKMEISGRHVEQDAYLIVDGRRVPGTVGLEDGESLTVELSRLPDVGMHLLQLQNPAGRFSNDFIFHVTKDEEAAAELRRQATEAHKDIRDAIAEAIVEDDLNTLKRNLRRQRQRIDEQQPSSGSTPLSNAALYGRMEIARQLIEQGANVHATNRDGNTALHVAAFLCQEELVRTLLKHGCSPSQRNTRGESPTDVVSSSWSDELAGFYEGIGAATGIEIDLKRLERERPIIAKILSGDTADAE